MQLVLISKFSQNFILKTRMLCFSRHSRQKCRKSRFLEQNNCFLPSCNKNALFADFWLPHLYNLLQPGSRKQHKYTSIHEHLYLAINKAKFALLLFQPSHCSGVVLCTEDRGLRSEDRGLRSEDRGLRLSLIHISEPTRPY